jgi:diguanylate cyclase (GGDEF)-like protein/PAS domain S-box-containing protein
MTEDRNERLAKLKIQAMQALQQHPQDFQSSVPAGADLHKLLEDLRIYQIELELQNEELRLAQQQAALASSRYQSLFDLLPVPAFVVDRHALIQQSNDVAQEWLGPCRAPGMQDFRLAHGILRTERPRFLSALSDAQGNTAELVQGTSLTDVKGNTRLVDAHVIKLPQTFHADHRYIVVLLDRSTEAAREHDRQLYQTVLDSSDDLIYATDETGRCLLANQATLSLIGLPLDKVLGRRRDAVLPLREAILQDMSDQKVLQSGRPISTQDELHGDSTRPARSFTTRKFPLRNAQGQVWGVGGISRDITAELETQLHQRWSELAFAYTSQAVIVTDQNTRILRVNPAFERMSGFSESTVLGQRTSILRSGRQGAEFYREMWSKLADQQHWAGELTNRSADGRFYTVWSSIDTIRNDDGELLGYLAVQTDLSELRRGQAEVERLASTDSLTGLPNRTLFEDRMGQLLTFSARQNSSFAVLFIDLDHFKQVNDALGHHAGDQLLQAIAQRLQQAVRAQDTVARLGGDEFVLLLPSTGRADALALAAKIHDHLTEPLDLSGRDRFVPEASIGLAMYPEDGETADQLVSNADTAMYAAKMAGRCRTVSYTATMSQDNARAFAVQLELQTALKERQLRLHIQPKFELDSLKVVGAEALVRWAKPGHGLVLPDDFLAVAERSGLMRELDAWVLEQAVELVGMWTSSGLWPVGWSLSVNQSATAVSHRSYATLLGQALGTHQVPPAALEIEIREGALVKPEPELLLQLTDLQALGVSLCIDDFGTGYSSLSYLQSLPVSTIKIDRTFVQDMLVEESNRVLIDAMIELGHKLGHTMVAEGVETPEQQKALLKLGCENAQGHLLGPAVDPQEFEDRYLRSGYTR